MKSVGELLKIIELQKKVIKQHQDNGNITSALKMNRKISNSILDSLKSSDFTPADKVKLVKKNKQLAAEGLQMMDYMLSVKAAANPNVALEKAVAQKGGNTHEMSEEERMYRLYNLCVIKDIKKTFEEVSGHESAIKRIKQSIVYPHQYPHLMNECHLPNGILMFGPPG